MKTAGIIIICILAAFIVYLWLIRTRLQLKKRKAPFMDKMYAHRGLHDLKANTPENSIPAFKYAVKEGFGIELDIMLSKDGVPVVFHDFTLQRMCGKPGKVENYTLEQLKTFRLADTNETIPTLEEALKVVNGRVPLIIELKIEGADISLCPIADNILRKYKGNYCIESFNPFGVLWYRRYRNDIMRGQLATVFRKEGYKGFFYFLLGNLIFNFLTRPDFIAYQHQYHGNVSRTLCSKLFRCVSAAWTIRSKQELLESKKYFNIFIFEGFMPDK